MYASRPIRNHATGLRYIGFAIVALILSYCLPYLNPDGRSNIARGDGSDRVCMDNRSDSNGLARVGISTSSDSSHRVSNVNISGNDTCMGAKGEVR
jgi:hypothetical protein